MAKKSNGTKAVVMGTMLGLVAGAAYALWKTPMSGKELRSKLNPVAAKDSSEPTTSTNTGITDKVMGAIEKTLAPIVGVELGKTANSTKNTDTSASSTTTGPISATHSQVPAASNGHSVATHEYGSGSIRAQRFAWGTPAPESVAVASTPPAPAAVATEAPSAPARSFPTPAAAAPVIKPSEPARASAPVEPQVPEAAPIEAVEKIPVPDVPIAEESTPIIKTGYGNDSIRAKRFTWGSSVTDDPAVGSTQTTSITAPTAVAVAEPPEPATPTSSGSGMVPFPKLGGLE